MNFSPENIALDYTLNAMSAISTGALGADDESGIFKALCNGIVADNAYPMAWVALQDENSEVSLRVAAKSGRWAEALDKGLTLCPHFGMCRDLAKTAMKTGQSQTGGSPAPPALSAHMAVMGDVAVAAVPIILEGMPLGCLLVGAPNANNFGPLHIRFFEHLVGSIKTNLKLHRSILERQNARAAEEASLRALNKTLEDAISTLSEAMVARDPYTVGHEKRVAGIALRIAQRMGYDEHRGHVVYLAALIHDIGKIKVPIELLTKPTPLRPEEFAIIKEHAAASYEILSKIAWPWPLADIAGQHHEKMDGSGYPHGLKGDQILPEARILAVADIIESVMSPRPYRGGLGAQKAIDIITASRGSGLCARTVDTALALFSENPLWIDEMEHG